MIPLYSDKAMNQNLHFLGAVLAHFLLERAPDLVVAVCVPHQFDLPQRRAPRREAGRDPRGERMDGGDLIR